MDEQNVSKEILINTPCIRSEKELRRIDNDCADCLYRAGILSQREVLGAVINNELTDEERLFVKRYWFENATINQIGCDYGISRKHLYRVSECVKKKIYNSMKYVLLYNELLDGRRPVPEDFHFKIINCKNGKELIS